MGKSAWNKPFVRISRHGRECKFRGARSIVEKQLCHFRQSGILQFCWPDEEVQHLLVDAAIEGRRNHVAELLMVDLRVSVAVDCRVLHNSDI